MRGEWKIILKTMGERIKEERKKIGLTQAEFSEKLRENGLEANRQKIAKWESGIQHLQDEELITLANYFNVSTDYLLGNSRVKTTDTNIKGICEYTGLSEEIIEQLHSVVGKDKELLEDIIRVVINNKKM